ncbi:MAG TPA: LCP family protein, partial [Pseudonocardiaceae bacterium]
VPVDGSRVVIVSFPPNLQVNRPACQQWNNQTSQVGAQVPAKPDVKLNSIYATGGPRCLTDTVQQLTGLRINHFVGIDLGGFRGLANSVGGVDMCVKAPLADAALGTIVNRAGPVTLSGDQALNFVRSDQIMGDAGVADFSRINRQQRFLAALLRKTIGQQNLLMNTNLLNNFLGTFTTSTFGDNMGVSGLAKLATSLQGLALGRISFVTLPTTGTLNQAGNELVNPDTSKQLFNTIIDNAPMPGEAAGTAATGMAATPAAPAVTPQGTKIQVLNATTEPNAASATANLLSQQGFSISGIGGPTPTVPSTVIKYAAPQTAQAQLLGSAVPSATLQVDPTMGGAIQLIIGPGFDHKVQAPHGGAGTNGTNAGSPLPAQLSFVNAADTACA